MVILVTLVTIVPAPRGVSSPAPLLLCPKGIIPRVGRMGISITLIHGQRLLSSLDDSILGHFLEREKKPSFWSNYVNGDKLR